MNNSSVCHPPERHGSECQWSDCRSAHRHLFLRRSRDAAARGFTLVELLVVIAIIAILAAILFPVFAQAKEAAKATQVLSNQKQIAIAQTLYITDSDDTLPAYFVKAADFSDGTFQRTDVISWPMLFDPYIKNGKPIWPSTVAAGADPGYVPPSGVQFNPTWSKMQHLKQVNELLTYLKQRLLPLTPRQQYRN